MTTRRWAILIEVDTAAVDALGESRALTAVLFQASVLVQQESVKDAAVRRLTFAIRDEYDKPMGQLQLRRMADGASVKHRNVSRETLA
jgi:hypothetical protein